MDCHVRKAETANYRLFISMANQRLTPWFFLASKVHVIWTDPFLCTFFLCMLGKTGTKVRE